jgi:uncharacterized protein
MDFSEILNGKMQEDQPLAGGYSSVQQPSAQPITYAGMTQPIPSEVQAMYQPTQDPAEIEKRNAGWMEVMKQAVMNPNIQRAMMYMGANLTAPRAHGQTALNQFAQSALIGKTAYDFGNDAEFARRQAMSKEAREKAESESLIKYRGAQTRGTELSNEEKQRTLEDSIARARADRQRAEADASRAGTDADVKKIELAYQERLKKIKDAIPDAAVRASVEAEFSKAGLHNDLTRAQIGASQASAGLAGQQAGRIKDERAVMEGMSDEEKRQFISRTGKYAHSVGSAQVQMAQYYKDNWKRANPKLAGEDEAAYEKRASTATDTYLSTAKDRPDSETFLRWAALYGSGDPIKDQKEFLKWRGDAPPGNTPAGGKTGVTVRTFDAQGNLIPQGK